MITVTSLQWAYSGIIPVPEYPVATLSNLDMHDCPFLFCNFFQNGVAKNKTIRIPKELQTTEKEFIIRKSGNCYLLIPSEDPFLFPTGFLHHLFCHNRL